MYSLISHHSPNGRLHLAPASGLTLDIRCVMPLAWARLHDTTKIVRAAEASDGISLGGTRSDIWQISDPILAAAENNSENCMIVNFAEGFGSPVVYKF